MYLGTTEFEEGKISLLRDGKFGNPRIEIPNDAPALASGDAFHWNYIYSTYEPGVGVSGQAGHLPKDS